MSHDSQTGHPGTGRVDGLAQPIEPDGTRKTAETVEVGAGVEPACAALRAATWPLGHPT